MPLVPTHWHKSSYSGQSGSCVEVNATPSGVGVRDTKDTRHTLAFGHDTWSDFVNAIKQRKLAQ